MAGMFDLESSSPPDTSSMEGTPDTGGARREFNKDDKMNEFKCPVGEMRDRKGNCVPAVGAMKKRAGRGEIELRDLGKERGVASRKEELRR